MKDVAEGECDMYNSLKPYYVIEYQMQNNKRVFKSLNLVYRQSKPTNFEHVSYKSDLIECQCSFVHVDEALEFVRYLVVKG